MSKLLQAPVQNLPVQKPFHTWHIDFLSLPKDREGYNSLLVCVEQTSLFPEAFPTKTQEAEEVAELLYSEIICRYGSFVQLISDRGKNFMPKLLQALCKLCHIKQAFTSSYHPASNSRAERMNGCIVQSLRLYCEKESNWRKFIPSVLMTYRGCRTKGNKFSPFFILHGVEMLTPLDTSIVNDLDTKKS